MSQADADLPLRERLAHWVEHLTHVLPAQAPITDFVHHNTLHGFQHLPFAEALAAAHALTGASPYWPAERFQAELAAGRMTQDDLLVALQESGLSGLAEELLPGVTRQRVWLACLTMPEEVPATPVQQWRWQEGIDANAALFVLCQALTATDQPESWTEVAQGQCTALFDRLGKGVTLRQLLLQLTGEDVLERVRSNLQRHLAAHLDLGMAAWSNPARTQGFYAAWRHSAAVDSGWDIDDLPNVRREIADLPDTAFEALLAELPKWLPDERLWPAYLESLALELPGWSGMFLWRDRHPGREARDGAALPVEMVDYLAVRLVLERLLCSDLILRLTGAAMSIASLGSYFSERPAEFYVRQLLHAGVLPEEQQHQAARLLDGGEGAAPSEADWLQMAEAIAAGRPPGDGLADARRLAILLAALALPAEQLAALSPEEARRLLAVADELSPLQRGQLCLQAYERHYREQVFSALAANRARPAAPVAAVTAQVVFCMDDREEGTRRHLEEIAPTVATYGAAGFFGVPMYWQGIDAAARTALCPVVVTPDNVVEEVALDETSAVAVNHAKRREMRLHWRERLYQQTRRSVLLAPLFTALAGLPALFALLATTLAPAAFGQTARRWREQFEGKLASKLALNAADDAPMARPGQPRHGFATAEQVDRVEDFLRSIGLAQDFAPLVLMFGHGSGSQNNPHQSAYDCGACSGRHGGPNARVFAAMANRPEVRASLAERGLRIPESCWFIAAEHNTCDDAIEWYDLSEVPASFQEKLDVLLHQVSEACRAHAVERCRRLASAPLGMSPWQAFRHVQGRLHDISQARPELGHATNAVALVGRRAMSQGVFFDRRAFLISYDPLADAAGDILERLLLAVGPVGAGINLEYYFSTVDNQRFGCGSKITHNITGLFGVMEGADSDLRTGLPWQMVEIHEPMRLLLVVEQTTEVLTRILGDQPALQELINNAWLIFAAQHPLTGAISEYCPRRGWLPWSGGTPLPQVARSQDWFAGERGPLAPAILLGAVT